jgi:hypothetical protein
VPGSSFWFHDTPYKQNGAGRRVTDQKKERVIGPELTRAFGAAPLT